MALHYIIDGYNVVNQVPDWSNLNLQEAREAFLGFVRINKLTGSPRNKVIVVFDANSAHLRDDAPRGEEYRNSAVNVVFSRNKTADDLIIEILQRMNNPKDALVVSDDKQLRRSAREYGAQLMNTKDFLKNNRRNSAGIADSDSPKLSAREMRQINEELEKIWLKDK